MLIVGILHTFIFIHYYYMGRKYFYCDVLCTDILDVMPFMYSSHDPRWRKPLIIITLSALFVTYIAMILFDLTVTLANL